MSLLQFILSLSIPPPSRYPSFPPTLVTAVDEIWAPCSCAALFQRALDLALFDSYSYVSRIMVSKLNVDYITKRLLVLINTDNKSEQDINDIIVHTNEKAPQLLEDLSIDSKRRIAKGMQIKYYEDIS